MKVAIVQDGPVYLDAGGTLERTKRYIIQAADSGADLVVFGENWFSGYPVWLDICRDVNLWDHSPVKSVWARMFKEGLSPGSPIMKELQTIIGKNELYVVLGANEAIAEGQGNGTVYNTIYTFDHSGNIVNHHRKLMPTYTEKLVHGLGDGAGLKSVPTPFGKLGSLICWEHWMPLARQAMHDTGEEVHVALWPFVKKMHHVACSHYAHEGRCHVIAVGQVMHQSELPEELEISDIIQVPHDGLIMKGGSAIYGPDGSVILPPLYGERKLIVRELSIERNLEERMNLSVSGHYQRPDIFSLTVNKERN